MWKEVEMEDKDSSCKNYANLKQSARMPSIGLRVGPNTDVWRIEGNCVMI